MKAEKSYLVLVAVTAILCVPALAKRPNQTLEGIDNLFVTIIHPDEEPNGLVWETLKAEVNSRLNKAGIKVFTPEPGVMYKLPIWPELKICVDMLKVEQSQQYVFHIQTLLAKNIYLQVKPVLRLKADVWKSGAIMRAVSIRDMPAKVTDVVLGQVEAFIAAYLAANPKGVQPTDANDIAVIKNEPPSRAVKSTPAEYKYVASKNSKVFHRPQCSSVKRISPKNLVGYSSRDEAIKAGKRPCKLCKP